MNRRSLWHSRSRGRLKRTWKRFSSGKEMANENDLMNRCAGNDWRPVRTEHQRRLAGNAQGWSREFRLIMKIEKGSTGGWNGLLLIIDQIPDRGVGITANSVTLEGSTLKFTINAARATYEGKVSADA